MTSNIKKWFILDFPELKTEIETLLNTDNSNLSNRFIQLVLIDFDLAEKNYTKAIEKLELLKKIDRIRENYY